MIKARRAVLWGLVVVVAACLGAGGAELPANVVYWSPDRPLTWSDFQGAPPAGIEKTVYVAQPFLTLSWQARYAAKGNGTTATASISELTVLNTLDPSRSWALMGRVNGDVLHHEQLHFDLREVYRRLLEITLRPMTLTRPGSAADCVTALSTLVKSTAEAILARSETAQASFEADTANGQNHQAQADWESRIASLLLNPAAAP